MDHQRKVSRHSNRRLLAHLLIAAAALAARWQYQIDQIQPLVELASDRVADFERAMTLKAPAASGAHCWAVKIVNWPEENDDARIEFMIPYGSTQAKVLARGRVEASQWRLTSVESQPAFCGWFVEGPLAGYQQVGNCHSWKHFLSCSSRAFRNRDFPWRLMP